MNQAMIFAAGLGTRLKPLTDTMPKALVPVGGEPLLHHVIMKLKASGYERIVVNVHHFAEQIIDYLNANGNFGLDIRISDERDGLLETGGGIKKALPLFDQQSPILIHNVDILSNLDLAEVMQPSATTPDALLLVSQRKTKRYLLFADDMRLKGWTNIETGEVRSPYSSLREDSSLFTPFPSEARLPVAFHSSLQKLAFSGIHVIWPSVFPLFSEMPERFGIIDFYLKYCHQYAFVGHEQHDLQLMDVGKLDTLHDAGQFLNGLQNKR